MTEDRKDDLRNWEGEVAAESGLDRRRRWVVWGTGFPAPDAWDHADAGNDVAEGIARSADPAWEDVEGENRWALVVPGDEQEVDALVQEDAGARGFAPYLVEGKSGEVPEGYMRGTLRDDVAPRRKVDQARPYD